MKWICFVFALTSVYASAQDYDSLKSRILKLESDQQAIQVNLSKCHKQFSTGTLFLVGGVVTGAMSMLLYDNSIENGSDPGRGKFNPGLLYLSAGLMTVGTIIHIDSHRWIRKAGKRHKQRQ